MAKKQNTKIEEISKKERLEKVRKEVNHHFKADILKFAEDYDGQFLLRRPTGVINLDLAIQGGFPKGIVEIAGPSNVGKNALSFTVCKENQKIYGEDSCIGLALIEPLDKVFAKNLGFHIAFSDDEIAMRERAKREMGHKDFKYSAEERAYLKKEVGHVMHVQCLTAEDMLYTALKMIESNEFQIVMIDSLGALITDEQDEKEIGDKTYGGNAIAIQSFVNKFIKIPTDTTVIAINQIRDVIGATQYQKKTRTLGGNALKHGKLISIELTPGERIKSTIKGTEVEVGRTINWTIAKQKCGGPDGEHGKYDFYKGKYGYPLGIDTAGNLVSTAILYDEIEQAGAWFNYGETRYQGKEGLITYFRNNAQEVEELKNRIFRKADVCFITKR